LNIQWLFRLRISVNELTGSGTILLLPSVVYAFTL